MGWRCAGAQVGVQVRIGSRDAEKANAAAARLRQAVPEAQAEGRVQGLLNPEAAAQAEVVVLTVPLAAQIPILKTVREHLRPGTIFVDATVPSGAAVGDRIARVVTPWAGSAAQQAAAQLPSHVAAVSAFHCLSATALADLSRPVDSDVLVCGDSREAKAVVKELVAKIAGARAIDAGPLENSRFAEHLAALLISLNLRYKVKHSGLRITGIPVAEPGGAAPNRDTTHDR